MRKRKPYEIRSLLGGRAEGGPGGSRLDPRAGMLEAARAEPAFSLNGNSKKLLEPQDRIQDTQGDLGAQMCWTCMANRKNIYVAMFFFHTREGWRLQKGMAVATESC